ncbi:hypothetical protein S83_031017 [Arachis hypogaea]
MRSAEQSREASMALPTPTCSSSSAPSVRRRNTLFLAPEWNDVAAAEIGEAPINAPRSTSRRWERRGVLVRSTEVDCCPHVMDRSEASDEGGGEVYLMILLLWRSRG